MTAIGDVVAVDGELCAVVDRRPDGELVFERLSCRCGAPLDRTVWHTDDDGTERCADCCRCEEDQ